MNDAQKLEALKEILREVAGREGCYPDGDVADGIIEAYEKITGDTV